MQGSLVCRCIVVANHLPLRLVRETEDSYDFERDEDALIAHVQVNEPHRLGIESTY